MLLFGQGMIVDTEDKTLKALSKTDKSKKKRQAKKKIQKIY